MNKNILQIGALNATRSNNKFWYNNKPFFGLHNAMVSDEVKISDLDSDRLRSIFSLDQDYNNNNGAYSRAQSDQKSTLDDQRKSANTLLKINSIDQVTSEVIVSGNKKSGFQKQIIFYNDNHIIFSLTSETTDQQWDSSDYVITGSIYMVSQVLRILSATSDMALKAIKDGVDRLQRLNDLEDKFQYYTTNLDNIYAWACDQYNTDKPTAKQLESICEYPLNYSDYEKIVMQIHYKQIEIRHKLPPVEYDGNCYRIKTNKRRGK